jgi:hypothetical protein
MDTRSEILEACRISLQRTHFLNPTAESIGTAYLQTSSLGKHSYSFVSARNFSTGSPRTDGQNKDDHKLGNDSDEKANTENWERNFVKGGESKTSNIKESILIPESPASYEELISYPGYIDKTKLIMDFFHEFHNNTCILSPRKSGKTTAIQMLKSFYWVPRIDVNTYDPTTKTYISSENIFKRMFDENPHRRAEFCKMDCDFIENNMGKWPVIHLDFKSVSFFDNPRNVTFEDVKGALIEKIIRPAFEEYDYLLFISIAEDVWKMKNKEVTKKNFQDLLKEHNLKGSDLGKEIDYLYREFEDMLSSESEKFYKYYTGQISTLSNLTSALKFLMERLYMFYGEKELLEEGTKLRGSQKIGKRVIVLVDEHDTPVTSIHSAMSLNNPEENKELMKSIEVFSGTVCEIFKKIAKGNPHLKQFLMFGISRGILEIDIPGFNNLRVYDVLDEDYQEYFGFDEQEVSEVIDSEFKNISDKHRGIIKANAKEWFNGYYLGENKSLHSTYSTFRYLNKWYHAFKKATEEQKADGSWIPEPIPEWLGLRDAQTIKRVIEMRLTGKLYHFLLKLSHGLDSYYKLEIGKVSPLLVNPTSVDARETAAFYLLLHNGYLTRNEKESSHFKIPNKEILLEFRRLVAEHLKSFFDKVHVPELLAAMKTQDFQSVGIEVTKSLYPLYLRRKSGNSEFLEADIENLIHLCSLELSDMDDGYVAVSKREGAKVLKRDDEQKSDSNEPTSKAQGQREYGNYGFRFDLHLKPKSRDDKVHYLIELKRQIKDDERISEKALEALKQIYAKDYFRHMILEEDTKAIVTMGLAAHFDKVCLVTLKIDVSNEMISGADTLSLQEFEITGKYGDNVEVKFSAQKEIKLKKPVISMDSKETDKGFEKQLDEAYRQAIDIAIEDAITEMKKPSLFKTILRNLKKMT